VKKYNIDIPHGVPQSISSTDTFDDVVVSLDRKKDRVEGMASPHSLLATTSDISPRFEKHTTCIGYQLLSKMGYTRGGLGKSGQGIIVLIITKLRLPRAGLGYNGISSTNKSDFKWTIFFICCGCISSD
jgi:hypothetical protein